MKKHALKKSEVLNEGYKKGLETAFNIIKEMMVQVQGVQPGEKYTTKEQRDLDDDLFYEAKRGNTSGVKKALEKGADPNVYDFIACNDGTPLHCACIFGYEDICKLLIQYGADIEARDYECQTTPLMFAAQNGHLEICKLLLKAGANPKAVDKNGVNALDYLRDYRLVAEYDEYDENKEDEIFSLLHGLGVRKNRR